MSKKDFKLRKNKETSNRKKLIDRPCDFDSIVVTITVVLIYSASSPPTRNYCANAIVNARVNMIQRGMIEKERDIDIHVSHVRTKIKSIDKLSQQVNFETEFQKIFFKF